MKICWPMGSGPPGYCGQNIRAKLSLMIATGTASALSCLVNCLPRFSLISSVWKYPGVIAWNMPIGRSLNFTGGLPAKSKGAPNHESCMGSVSVTAALRIPGSDSVRLTSSS